MVKYTKKRSGDFAESSSLSITDQILHGRRQTSEKYQGQQYLAYFQAFTNTYAPLPRLRQLYEEAIRQESICGIIIGTRPDCLPEPVLQYM